jgi:hypothetical protein
MDWKTLVIAVLAVTVLLPGAAAAQEANNTTAAPPDDGGGSGPLQDLVEMLSDFIRNLPQMLTEVLKEIWYDPALTLADALVDIVVSVLMHTPSVQNPAVQEVHQDSLIVAYLLAALFFVVAGLLYITGPIFNVSYQQVRMIIPRLVAALAFGTISLYLLEFSVEFTNALTHAFEPDQMQLRFQQAMGISISLIIVIFVKAVLLLAVILMYIMRDTLILILAAGSPIIAICWAFPKTKRYADSFIAIYWTALAIAPLNVFTLKFVFAMMEMSGSSALQSVSNWVFGMAGLTLLLLVPYHLYGASQTVVGPASSMAGKSVSKMQAYLQSRGESEKGWHNQYEIRDTDFPGIYEMRRFGYVDDEDDQLHQDDYEEDGGYL